LKKENFDNVTKINTPSHLHHRSATKKEEDKNKIDLIPEDYEDHLIREDLLHNKDTDPFKLLGVSNEDKLKYYLLKWRFN
jgi:hypothetical protein